MSSLYSPSRIGKNTILLYIRMGVIMVVNFFTVRILLDYLGVEDYGLYNVLMGIITLFSFVSASMTSATQRFLSYELGENDYSKLIQVFSASFYLYIAVILVSVLLFETVGIWYVNRYLNIPENRIVAAHVVFQCVILQYVILTIRIPFNALVIAHERMDFFAYSSIVEAVLALVLIFVLKIVCVDKLILYAILVLLSRLMVTLVYIVYCNRSFKESHLIGVKKIRKSTINEIWSFSGWSIFGSMAVACNGQGLNLLVNYFCGVVVNASVGIATQLTNALYGVVSNLQTAFNPQLVKLYAAKEYSTFYLLVNRNCKVCFLLFLYISLPLCIVMQDVLDIWLGRECLYAVEICRCLLIFQTIEALSYPLTIAIQAVGKVRLYQQLSALLFFLMIPVAIILLKMGFSPIFVYAGQIILNVLILTLRIIYLGKIADFRIDSFIGQVLLKVFLVVLISAPIPCCLAYYIDSSWVRIVCISVVSFILITVSGSSICLNKKERVQIKILLREKLSLQK